MQQYNQTDLTGEVYEVERQRDITLKYCNSGISFQSGENYESKTVYDQRNGSENAFKDIVKE